MKDKYIDLSIYNQKIKIAVGLYHQEESPAEQAEKYAARLVFGDLVVSDPKGKPLIIEDAWGYGATEKQAVSNLKQALTKSIRSGKEVFREHGYMVLLEQKTKQKWCSNSFRKQQIFPGVHLRSGKNILLTSSGNFRYYLNTQIKYKRLPGYPVERNP